jgi:outer membrane protein
MKLKNTLGIIFAASALAASVSTAFAMAPGESILRLRAIQVEPDVSGVNGVDVDGNTGGEVGWTGILSDHWALDFGIGTSKHYVSAGGADAGSVKLMPVNLTLQYHFLPDANFRPYIGAGGNYTRFYEVRLRGADVDRDRFGPVAQVGVDIPLAENVLLNLDVKKVWLKTDLSGTGGGELKLDPWVYGVGLGFRF